LHGEEQINKKLNPTSVGIGLIEPVTRDKAYFKQLFALYSIRKYDSFSVFGD
jgi:hypothetical protein